MFINTGTWGREYPTYLAYIIPTKSPETEFCNLFSPKPGTKCLVVVGQVREEQEGSCVGVWIGELRVQEGPYLGPRKAPK